MKGVLAMPLSMTLEPVQKQQLTQHLIQQMNLLQMTSEELDAFVAREVEQNPLLDFPEERETWREEGPEWRRMHLRARDPSDDPPSSPVENAHALEMTLEAFLDDQIGCLSLHIYCMDQKLIAVTSQFFHNIQCHSDICKFLPAVCHNIVFSIFSATAQVKNQFLFSHSLFHFVQIFPGNPSIFKYIRCNDYMTGTCTKIFPCIFRVHSSADL